MRTSLRKDVVNRGELDYAERYYKENFLIGCTLLVLIFITHEALIKENLT